MTTAATKQRPTEGIRQVPLGAIKLDPLAQPRAEIDHDLVEEYAEAMATGDQFPPLVVFNDRRTYWLADGFHRHKAAAKAALREVACIVKEGGQREAILHSCSANAVHGWRRSNGDKRRAVLTLLADDEWGSWSDREIARHCKVDHKTVAKIREENRDEYLGNSPDGDAPESGAKVAHAPDLAKQTHGSEVAKRAPVHETEPAPLKRTVARGGTIYQMDTSRIGAKSAPATPADPSPELGEGRSAAESDDDDDILPPKLAFKEVSARVSGLFHMPHSPAQIAALVEGCPDEHRDYFAEQCSEGAMFLASVAAALGSGAAV